MSQVNRKTISRGTKIVATIGPASRSPEVLSRLIDAGVNVVRMNFSHGTHEDHRQTYEMVRQIAAEKGVPVGILQDLQGPKVRVGTFETPEGVMLVEGQEFTITSEAVPGNIERVSTTYTRLPGDVTVGMQILLDDGNITLKVTDLTETDVKTVVVAGGRLTEKKGINVPKASLSTPALSDKDIDDLKFGAELGVDWVALSFVRSRDDLLLARQYLKQAGSKAKLMAKIEKPQAVDNFADILQEADGIMVARGDLGVEMLPEQVPGIQKTLIRKCREAGKPVITATQMLESMKDNSRPTRAEASDVANAIFDGTDAVMLSAESATGKYPIEAVQMMHRIAVQVENSQEYDKTRKLKMTSREPQEAIAMSAFEIGRDLNASAVMTFTSSGGSSARIAKYRPPLAIVALTPYEHVRNQQTLLWGVQPVLSETPKDSDDMVRIAAAELRRKAWTQGNVLDDEHRFVITAGVPFGVKGTTNMLRVASLEDEA